MGHKGGPYRKKAPAGENILRLPLVPVLQPVGHGGACSVDFTLFHLFGTVWTVHYNTPFLMFISTLLRKNANLRPNAPKIGVNAYFPSKTVGKFTPVCLHFRGGSIHVMVGENLRHGGLFYRIVMGLIRLVHQTDPLALGDWVGLGHRGKQRAGVGVDGMPVKLVAVRHLHQLAVVHHPDAVRKILNDR